MAAPAKGSTITHPSFGKCTVLRVSPDGTKMNLMDANDDVHKDVPVASAATRKAVKKSAPAPAPAPAPAHNQTVLILVIMLATAVNLGWKHIGPMLRTDPTVEMVRSAVRGYPVLMEGELIDKLIAANDGSLTGLEFGHIWAASEPAIGKNLWKKYVDGATALQDEDGVFSDKEKLDTYLKAAKKGIRSCR